MIRVVIAYAINGSWQSSLDLSFTFFYGSDQFRSRIPELDAVKQDKILWMT